MKLSLIVAIASDLAMGRHNALPWHIPEDLQFFKRTTLGKPVVMGSKTWKSLGRPLPGRVNIVISSRNLDLPQGVQLCHSLEDAIARMKEEPNDEGFIIGGSKVFEDALPQLERMYITRVDTTVPDADTFFPKIDYSKWNLTWEEKHERDEKHKYDFAFQQWDRIPQ